MKSIGFVTYTHIPSKNILEAKGISIKNGVKSTGTGIVTGDFSKGFEGTFEVQYFDLDGKPTSKFQLEISKETDYFYIKWYKDGKYTYFGIGQEKDGVLCSGWRSV